MIALTAGRVAEMTGGRLEAGDPEASIGGTSIDSRTLRPGDLFVALAGEHADGHSFVADAAGNGAAAVLVGERFPTVAGVATIRVGDAADALLRLAAAVRLQLTARVIAITGSSGKTMTKDLTAAVARSRFRTIASEASFNNEIGVPLTVLAAKEDTEVLVAEVGSRGVGHIASLVPVLRPEIGVVLNVGVAHLGMFGSVEAIAQAKGELVEGLPPEGTAVLNSDDQAVAAMAARTPARVLTFGSGTADVRAEDLCLMEDATTTFMLRASDERSPVAMRIPGEHVVADALAAAAAGVALGVPVAAIADALSRATGPSWRMEVSTAPGGWTVVNDAYNANPASTAAALKALVTMGRGRRTWAVLGPMAELGTASHAEHDRIGRLAVRLGVARLVAVGEGTRALFEAARLEGMTPEEAVLVADASDAAALLGRELAPGDVVLVKASRAAALERLAFEIGARRPGEEARA